MKVIGVTACPSGVAHTYMAAESLQEACKENGVSVHIETQGSIGIENELKPIEIREADVVILTNDIGIKNENRFKGKPVLRISTSECIQKGSIIIKKLAAKFSTINAN
ncbi:PTS fructose-like transporter subunit IIB [Sporolactobacillus vineae]|uniref:PTS fructose-like transporter subunit IIB n=1 Tax=Sporolactobacillus vineae TaxID=444463 RepID=UPI0002894383|nr:PTS fructose-like transporter subunit IIB [Sporolactobacillus vineae]